MPSRWCCYLPSDDPTELRSTSRRRENLERTRTLDPGPLADGPREGLFNRAGVARGTGPEPTTVRRRPQLSYLPDGPLRSILHRRDGERGLSVRILRYRYRGWDEPELHPVQDARWALTQLWDQLSRDSLTSLWVDS